MLYNFFPVHCNDIFLTIYLACTSNLLTGLYILPSVISSFFQSFFYLEQSYLSIYWTKNNFHDLFTKWKVFAWMFLIRSSFSDSSRDVAMATNLVAKMGQNYLPPALIALSFRNWMAYRLANMRINSYTNCSTSCEKMVKIGSVVFEL